MKGVNESPTAITPEDFTQIKEQAGKAKQLANDLAEALTQLHDLGAGVDVTMTSPEYAWVGVRDDGSTIENERSTPYLLEVKISVPVDTDS